MEDLTGKQLGPYRIVSPLGEGGMAAVYRAYQASMDRYVALKILPRHFASDPEFVGRFTQEAKVIANLQHPHILPVHDFGEADGYTYLVMRFIEGGTLSDWLKDRTPLPMTRIRHIISQVGGALDYAHARGVIHRDIKPSNILVDQWDNCLLTDFGLAKMVESSSYLTQTGGILGTPAYMSPEQGLGQKVDHRSDIYSLGVVLYQMAVGHLPYQAETPMAVVIKHIHDPLPPPSQRDPTLSEAVEKVILKSLAKDPNDRFATAGDLVKALQGATDSITVAREATAEKEAEPQPVVSPPTAAAPVSKAAEEISSPQGSKPSVEAEAVSTGAAGLKEVMQRLEPTVLLAAEEEEAASTPQPSSPTPVPTAVAQRPKSKVPWILGGISAILVIAILAVIAGGFFSNGDEEEVTTVADDTSVTIDEPDRGEEARPLDVEEAQEPPEPGSERPGISVDEILAQFDIAYEEGDLGRARRLIDEAIALEPDRAELWCQRGYLMQDLESPDEAAANFERCLATAEEQRNPDLQQEALAMLAVTRADIALIREENADLAIQIIDEALDNPIAPAWLHCQRAELLLTIGQRIPAMETFEACHEGVVQDEYWSLRSRTAVFQIQGELALEEERYLAAIDSFSQWAELEPEEPWPHCYQGDAYLSLGIFDRSIGAFERCRDLAEDPDAREWAEVGTRVARAKEAMAREDWDAALQLFEEVIRATPDEAWLYCERASLFISLDARVEAARDIGICRELSGDDPGMLEWTEELQAELEGG